MTSRTDANWWKNTVIYHVYLPSFKDNNGDGMGDIPGLTSKLDYFDYLKVKTLMISPFFPSPMFDNGYDVSDFTDIDPKYGTMEDFDNLLKCLKEKGMHLILDFPFNHTSDRHKWFQKSIKGEDPYKDYYVWVDPRYTQTDVMPPNNWLSVFHGSAWEWNQTRQQYYLHQFLPEQPDLNLRNPDVRKEIKKILKFWLDKGIDGFRVDAASHLFEDEDLRDEPLASLAIRSKVTPDDHEFLDHVHTKGHPENLVILEEWKDLLTSYQQKDKKYRLLLAEVVEPLDATMRYYGTEEKPLSDVPFNFLLTKLDSFSTARDLHKAITTWMSGMPSSNYPNWILSNHDLPRLASKIGNDLVSGFHMIVLLLPGIVFSYYGDELRMENVPIDPQNIQDSFALRTKPENSRDPSRTPMQWDNTKFAGFTDGDNTWLPIHKNYKMINVEAEKTNPYSMLEIYRKLLLLRDEDSISKGWLDFPLIDGNIFSMTRVFRQQKSFLIILNMGLCACVADLSKSAKYLPKEVTLEISNNKNFERKGNMEEEDDEFPVCMLFKPAMKVEKTQEWKIRIRSIFLLPKEAMVLSFIPVDIE